MRSKNKLEQRNKGESTVFYNIKDSAKKEFYIHNLANGCIQISDAIEEHIAHGVKINFVTNISATVNNSRPLPMKAGRGPSCLAGRVFSHGKRDSPSPNLCRFHRGVSDVSFYTSGNTYLHISELEISPIASYILLYDQSY